MLSFGLCDNVGDSKIDEFLRNNNSTFDAAIQVTSFF